MLLICTAKVSLSCTPTRSAHTRSAGTKDCICPSCANVLRNDPSLKDVSLASILKGKGNAKDKTSR